MGSVTILADRAKSKGFQCDPEMTAYPGARDPTSVKYDMKRCLMLPGESPVYLAILGTHGAYSGRGTVTAVPEGGAMVLFVCGEQRYQGLFDESAEPLEEHAKILREKVFA